MPAVPSQRDWTRGELATAAEVNTNVSNPITFYRQRPMWLAAYITNFSVASDTNYHTLSFSSGDVFVDSENAHAGGDDKIYCVQPGLYVVEAQVLWTANIAGMRRLKFAVVRASTGTFSTIQETGMVSSGQASFAHSGQTNVETSVRLHDPGFYMDAGDYIQFQAGQNSGSSLNLLSGPTGSDKPSWFCIRWVAAN